MKGIIKGSLFSLALMFIFICILSAIRLYIDIPDTITKGLLWCMCGLCVFSGCLPVSRSATNNALVRGIASALITMLIIWIVASFAAKGINLSGSFYSLMLICFVCGMLGAFVGVRK